jgi:hypothetical protein
VYFKEIIMIKLGKVSEQTKDKALAGEDHPMGPNLPL